MTDHHRRPATVRASPRPVNRLAASGRGKSSLTGDPAVWCLPNMMRFLLIVWMVLAVAPALAQRPATQAAPAQAPTAQTPAPLPAMPPDQAAMVLEVLKDPAKRAAFTATLEAILRAQSATQPGAPQPGATPPGTTPPGTTPPGATPPVAAPASPSAAPPARAAEPVEAGPLEFTPGSLAAQVLVSASAFVNTIGTEFRMAVNAVRSIPLLWGWIETMMTSEIARAFLIDVTWRTLLAFILAVGVQHGTRRLLRRPIDRMEAAGWPAPPPETEAPLQLELTPEEGVARAEAGDLEPPRHKRGSAVLASLRRLPRLLARLGLELLPVLATVLAGHLLVGSILGGQATSRLIILAVVDSYAVCTAILRISRVLLRPADSRFAVISPTQETADRLIAWIRRLTVGGIVGYVFAEVGYLLGMSPIAHSALLKAVGLYVVVVLAILTLQNRSAVADWIRTAGVDVATPDPRLIRLRDGLARIWHWIACAGLATGWVFWTLEHRDTTESFLRTIILTGLIIGISRFVQLALHGLLDKGMAFVEADGSDYGILARRMRVYHRSAHRLLSVIVNTLTALILLQIYGLGGLNWLLTAPLGRRTLAAITTIAITVGLALAVWEAVNAAVQTHLTRLDRESNAGRSARLRTLLPLMRTTLIVTIGIMSGLMILSEIGVNIAPLLAGAGIVGIAIGFGSQKLVTDLITGVFLLLENAMQVGDVVKVGELVGTVESLSVRTIRLRSEDGSVHVIPFSAVTTVTNMTREFSRAVLQVTVAIDEDYERVVDALRDIVREMREAPAWSGIIQDDLEVFGLDKLDTTSLTIRCRIRCTAFGRWSVGREFNRRLKERFEELQIRLPAGVVTVRG